ncbi:MAG TPA: EAL domain-containing protein [Actinomycetota bacterium]|nr:EAL domain-containing protein [Actinomycetota bacterium]
MDRIRVMVADDEDQVLDVMSDLIASDPALDVVGTARDARQAVRLARAVAPDVALVDVRMPAGGGAVATRGIRRESPPTRVVAVSADADPGAVVAMLDAGASGYVGKDEPLEQILRAVHRAVDGKASIAVSSAGPTVERLVERGVGTSTRERRAAAERIARVIEGPALEMVYQPIVRLTDGRVVGLEALARFRATPRHREPDAWFAEAASVGLLVELELAAIERALTELDRIPEGTFLSLNLSPEVMCCDELAPLLDGVADRLVLEMTEGSPLPDHERVLEKLRPLRDQGARLAIDDVGAGYAGLARVVLLEPELVKLDRSVVAGASEDRRRRALIGRLVAFSHDVGIEVVAEGIETQADLEVLRSLSVPFGQGFHLGRPGPLPDAVGDPISWPGRHAFHGSG